MDQFRRLVAEVSDTPEIVGMDLRIQFSSLLGRLLKDSDWSQAELSRRTRINQPEISEYMHGDANITVDQMGRILHAFGVRGRLSLATAEPNGDKDNSNGKAWTIEKAEDERSVYSPAEGVSSGSTGKPHPAR